MVINIMTNSRVKMNNNTLNYYNTNAINFVSSTISVKFKKTQDKFLSFLPVNTYILDFGCGSGRDTKYFLSAGMQVDAIDGSEELCKLASKYTGIPVRQMLFEALDVKAQYDGIWACSSILHQNILYYISYFYFVFLLVVFHFSSFLF